MSAEDQPWQVELCVSVKAPNADAARELAGRVEAAARRVAGRSRTGGTVEVFCDTDEAIDNPERAAEFASQDGTEAQA